MICCTFSEGWSKRITKEPIDDRPGGKMFEAHDIEEVFKILLDEIK